MCEWVSVRERDSRVPLLVLHGSQAPLGCQEVADVASGGPGQEGAEHALTHLECRLHGMGRGHGWE